MDLGVDLAIGIWPTEDMNRGMISYGSVHEVGCGLRFRFQCVWISGELSVEVVLFMVIQSRLAIANVCGFRCESSLESDSLNGQILRCSIRVISAYRMPEISTGSSYEAGHMFRFSGSRD